MEGSSVNQCKIRLRTSLSPVVRHPSGEQIKIRSRNTKNNIINHITVPTYPKNFVVPKTTRELNVKHYRENKNKNKLKKKVSNL